MAISENGQFHEQIKFPLEQLSLKCRVFIQISFFGSLTEWLFLASENPNSNSRKGRKSERSNIPINFLAFSSFPPFNPRSIMSRFTVVHHLTPSKETLNHHSRSILKIKTFSN